METIIATHDLCKSFGSKRAVDHLSLTVPRGSIFALLGDNGAGKTTTIRMLTGLAPPDSGTATILGKDCWAHAVSLRTKVGYVPERPRFYDWMTVSEIGWFTAEFHEKGYLERFGEWSRKFELDAKSRLEKFRRDSAG